MAGGVRPFPLKPKSKAVRAIPRDQWSDDIRERQRFISQGRIKNAPQFGKGPNVGAPQISGRRVRSAVGGASYNPAQSPAKFR